MRSQENKASIAGGKEAVWPGLGGGWGGHTHNNEQCHLSPADKGPVASLAQGVQ